MTSTARHPAVGVGLRTGAAFAVAGVLSALVLLAASDDARDPPAQTLVAAASLIALVTAAALWFVVRRDLNLPARIAVLAATYNAILVAVKFWLGPLGLYEVNRTVEFSSIAPPGEVEGAALIAGGVLALYGGAYVLIYLFVRRELRRRAEGGPVGGPLAVAVVAIPVACVGGLGGLVAGFAFWLVGDAGSSVGFVFESSVSLAVAVLLAIAASLLATTLHEVGARGQAVGDAALLVTFLWVGLYFLALYHALWVVYLMILIAIWPLRVVVPK